MGGRKEEGWKEGKRERRKSRWKVVWVEGMERCKVIETVLGLWLFYPYLVA